MRAAGRAAQGDVRRRRHLARASVSGAVRRVVLRRPARRPRPRPARPGRRGRRGGRVGAGHQRRDGELHAAYNVCRHRGSQLCPVEPGAGTRPATAAGALRCPYHSWTYDLDGQLLKAPHTERGRRRPGGVLAAPGRGRRLGGLRASSTSTPGERRDSLDDAVAAPARRLAQLPHGRPGHRAVLTYDVAANYKVLAENYNECYHCGPVHPELTRLVPAFAGGGVGFDWEDGHPAPRGSVDLHDDRHHQPGAASRASTRPSAPGTRASWSTRTCAVRAQPTTSRRSCCCRRPSTGPGSSASCCSQPPRRCRRRLRPVRRRRPLGPRQPAGLGDLRVGAARDVLARLPARLVRPDGGRQRRHPPLAAPAAGGLEPMTRAVRRTSSSASARSAARRPTSWRGAATRWSGWSGSSSGTTAAPATTPAGSCGTATTRPGTSG